MNWKSNCPSTNTLLLFDPVPCRTHATWCQALSFTILVPLYDEAQTQAYTTPLRMPRMYSPAVAVLYWEAIAVVTVVDDQFVFTHPSMVKSPLPGRMVEESGALR